MIRGSDSRHIQGVETYTCRGDAAASLDLRYENNKARLKGAPEPPSKHPHHRNKPPSNTYVRSSAFNKDLPPPKAIKISRRSVHRLAAFQRGHQGIGIERARRKRCQKGGRGCSEFP